MVVFLGGVVYMKPFHKQRLVTPWLFSWILKDICFSPGACKQRLGTRVLFSWGGCLQQILKDICFSPGACKQRLGTRVLFSWGGVVYNKLLKIFVSPQGPANKDWEPVHCFGGVGEELRRNSSKIESYKSVSEITWVPKQTTSKL